MLSRKAGGLKVTLYPFVLMDVPAGAGLIDPWGGAEQGAYPWRGRFTCHPAHGQPRSPDGNAGAASQVASIFGSATPGQFGQSDGLQTFSGGADWCYLWMVLHAAALTLAGDGGVAVQGTAGVWEVIGYTTASLVAPEVWTLSGLLRGQWDG